jgi:hypothetical protein
LIWEFICIEIIRKTAVRSGGIIVTGKALQVKKAEMVKTTLECARKFFPAIPYLQSGTHQNI